MMLIDLFEAQAAKAPDSLFVRFVADDPSGDVALTYGEADRRASAFARLLADRGVGKGDVVALLVPNSADWLTCYFGSQKIGAITAGLNTDLLAKDLEFYVRLVKARVIVTTGEFNAIAASLAQAVPSVDFVVSTDPQDGMVALPRGGEPLGRDPALADTDYLSIVFTSGTTGSAPKAALQTSGSIVRGIAGYQDRLRIGAADRVTLVTPLFHGSALNWGVTMSVIGGAGIVLARKFSASRFWEQAERGGSTVLWTMGAIVLILLTLEPSETERRAARRLRIIFGAATAARWRQIADRWPDATVLDGFGMTETPGTLTEDDCYGLPDRYPCVGRPVRGVDLRIADPETGETMQHGEVGEIVVRYGQGFAGYFENPKAFEEAVRDGWFRTGDLAYQDETGRVFFVDRLKAIIRRGGENISSLEIEEVLARHPQVAEAVALPKPHPILGDTVLVALVPKTAGHAFTIDEIRAFCEGKLAPFKLPEDVRTIEAAIIPRTETGRVKKPMLRKALGL